MSQSGVSETFYDPYSKEVGDENGPIVMVNFTILIFDQGEYHNTSLAHHGDRGSKLPALPTGTVWKAGGTAEVRVMVMIINVGDGNIFSPLCPL